MTHQAGLVRGTGHAERLQRLAQPGMPVQRGGVPRGCKAGTHARAIRRRLIDPDLAVSRQRARQLEMDRLLVASHRLRDDDRLDAAGHFGTQPQHRVLREVEQARASWPDGAGSHSECVPSR